MRKPACSIIIRAYNEEKHIRRLLQGITGQTIKDVQIILVDSGSTDGTLAATQGYPVEEVKILPENFTFGRSLNMGIASALSDIVIMASAHVYPVYPDWLEQLIAPFEDPKVGLSYGKQRGTDHSHFSEQQVFKHWYPEISDLQQASPFCNNANAAIRRSVWELHHYDETLPGLEDLEWGKWIQGEGFRIAYVAEAEIIHVHAETQHGIYNRYRREGMAFKRIYPHERFGKLDLLRLFYHNAVDDLKAARLQKTLRYNFWRIIQFRWAQFYGTYHGYRQSGPLTWALRQTFYYPRATAETTGSTRKRDIEPIQYSKM
jgi:glycosyltransferase involved in cell wall biosynthesis